MTRRAALLTLALGLVVVGAAALADRSVVRVEDLAVGACFLYDRTEVISGVETLDCDAALAAVSDPTGPVAALVVWRGPLDGLGPEPTDAADAACEPFRASSPVVVPVVLQEVAEDGTAALCLALGR